MFGCMMECMMLCLWMTSAMVACSCWTNVCVYLITRVDWKHFTSSREILVITTSNYRYEARSTRNNRMTWRHLRSNDVTSSQGWRNARMTWRHLRDDVTLESRDVGEPALRITGSEMTSRSNALCVACSLLSLNDCKILLFLESTTILFGQLKSRA